MSASIPKFEHPAGYFNIFLVLNGDGTGWVNGLTVPSIVAPTYAPAGQHLVSVVVIRYLDADDTSAETIVREELTEWFGSAVGDWRHLRTYRIAHALPEQPPPMCFSSTPHLQGDRPLA